LFPIPNFFNITAITFTIAATLEKNYFEMNNHWEGSLEKFSPDFYRAYIAIIFHVKYFLG